MQINTEGGMNNRDLQELIDRRIPDNRTELEKGHANLKNVADYCEKNYITSNNQAFALDETKQFAVQSLASVAYQVNKMTTDILDMLDLMTEKISSQTNQGKYETQIINIHKEKLARREIGALTTNKTLFKLPKITVSGTLEPRPRYQRTPIDYSVLDGIGHGVRVVEPQRSTLISRAASSISGSSPSQYHSETPAYGMFSAERTATLGRSMMRQYAPSIAPSMAPSDYRLPQVSSQSESRMTRQMSHGSEIGDHLSGGGSGSHHGSSDYNSVYQTDRYGTIRANNVGRVVADGPRLSSGHSSGGLESPTFPLPPPQLSSLHYNGYVAPGSVVQQQQQQMQQMQQYSTIRRSNVSRNDLPPPPSSVITGMSNEISTHDDMDDLPPPPESVGSSSAYGVFSGNAGIGTIPTANLFDVSSDWVPNGEFIEKARVLYDYDAEKEDELTLRENAVVYIVKKNEDGWYEGVLDGVTGLFPGNYVEKL